MPKPAQPDRRRPRAGQRRSVEQRVAADRRHRALAVPAPSARRPHRPGPVCPLHILPSPSVIRSVPARPPNRGRTIVAPDGAGHRARPRVSSPVAWARPPTCTQDESSCSSVADVRDHRLDLATDASRWSGPCPCRPRSVTITSPVIVQITSVSMNGPSEATSPSRTGSFRLGRGVGDRRAALPRLVAEQPAPDPPHHRSSGASPRRRRSSGSGAKACVTIRSPSRRGSRRC